MPHRDYISLPPKGLFVIVFDHQERAHCLPLLTMTGLIYPSKRTRPAREDKSQRSLMIDEIRKLLAARPFVPFTIVTTGGSRYRVASNEHAAISPQPFRVVVWFDEGGGVPVPALHIASVEQEPARAA